MPHIPNTLDQVEATTFKNMENSYESIVRKILSYVRRNFYLPYPGQV